MSTVRPAEGQLFQPGAQSLTGTFDPVYVTREAAHGSWNVTPQPAVGLAWTPRSEWLVRRADVGWRQIGAARRLFLPAIHHAAAVHLGLWLLVWRRVLPAVQCQSRYRRRTGEVLPGQRGARPGQLAAAIMRHLIRSAVFHLRPGEERRCRPLDGLDLPRRLCLGHARRHQAALHVVLDHRHSAGPGREPGTRGSL